MLYFTKIKYTRSRKPKLSDEEIEWINVLLELGHEKTEIARQFQVSRQTIYNALRRANNSG